MSCPKCGHWPLAGVWCGCTCHQRDDKKILKSIVDRTREAMERRLKVKP